MKKKLVSLVLCMALLSSFTVSASAYDVNDIYNQVTAIRDELGYPDGNWSSLRRAVNYIADHLPSSPNNYSTVLSNIESNFDSLLSYINLIEGDTNSITSRCTELVNLVNTVNSSIGTAQIAITNHLDSFATQNHTDLTSFATQNHADFSKLFQTYTVNSGSISDSTSYSLDFSFPIVLGYLYNNLTFSGRSAWWGSPTLYWLTERLQQVLASDDDLQLKQDNKANEDAATDAFVTGSSSKTSLGTGDIGNLKDVGGTFNDLTSLNGQSSISSFLSGLTSADGTGQGWFSEATRASLDAVSAPVTTTRLVQKHWRGEKSLTYSISEDTSVNVVRSPAPARAPVADSDPYNMSGFDDNYNWLWGDAS